MRTKEVDMTTNRPGRLYMFLLLGVTLGAACGGPPPEPEVPPPPPATSEPPVAETPPPPPTTAPPPTAEVPKEPPKPQWKDMSMDQRKEHMKNVVLPKMTTLFQGFDPKKFKDVTCATCHGKDAEKAGFKMPNAKLPKLDPTDGFKKHMAGKTADMTKFMMEKVTPEMLGMLPGVAPYDPATQKGFGCFGCHPPPK
jgi:hypothetical protein